VAAAAAVLARCADAQKYFSMIETLFQQQDKWAVRNPIPPLMEIAQQAGFTEDSFKVCLANREIINGIEWVRARAADPLKVTGTPTFFINGNKHTGAMTLDEIEATIKPYLKK
jgi:protein-disulfide isomerase